GARTRNRRRGAPGAAARRFPRRPVHDPLFLGAGPVSRGRRYVGAVRGRAPRADRRLLALVLVAGSAAACGGATQHDQPLGAPPALYREVAGLPVTVARRSKLVVIVFVGDRILRCP